MSTNLITSGSKLVFHAITIYAYSFVDEKMFIFYFYIMIMVFFIFCTFSFEKKCKGG